MSTKVLKEKFYGWRMVILSALTLTFVGNFWSNATTVSNTLMMSAPGNTITAVTYGFGYTLGQIVTAVSGFLVAYIMGKRGPKVLYKIGAIFGIVSGLLLVNFQENNTIIYLLNYSILGNLAYKFCGTIPNQTITANWLVKKRGMGSALINIGTVFAGVITPPVATYLINTMSNGKWQVGYYIYGVTSILGLILAFFIINKPSDIGQHPDGIDPALEAEKIKTENKSKENVASSKVFKNVNPEKHYTLKMVFKNKFFWSMLLLCVLLQVLATFMMNPGALIFKQSGFTMETISYVLTLRQVFRLIFLFLLMRYMDRIEPIKILIASSVLATVMYFLSANPQHVWQLVVFYMGGSIIMSAVLAIPGVILANTFGNTHFGKFFSIFISIFVFGASFGSTIWGALRKTYGSYAVPQYIVVAIGVIALFVGIIAIIFQKKEAEKLMAEL